MVDYKSIQQIADDKEMSYQGVRNWIDKGLPYKMERITGSKPRMVLDPVEVDRWLRNGIYKVYKEE